MRKTIATYLDSKMISSPAGTTNGWCSANIPKRAGRRIICGISLPTSSAGSMRRLRSSAIWRYTVCSVTTRFISIYIVYCCISDAYVWCGGLFKLFYGCTAGWRKTTSYSLRLSQRFFLPSTPSMWNRSLGAAR